MVPKFQESVERSCKFCGVIGTKVQHGRFPSGPKRWRSASGEMFVGNVCPECHRKRMREYQREKRASERLGSKS